MKVGIFEGPEVTRAAGEWVPVPGQELPEWRASLCCRVPFRGWRNYLIKFWPVVGEPQTRSCCLSEAGVERLVRLFCARFFPRGTWEAAPYVKNWPSIRPEVEAEILGTAQSALAL